MMRVRFREVALRGIKYTMCAGGCGKRLRRQKKFWQTRNPWNTTESGDAKTEREIFAELAIKAEQWKAEAAYCLACCPACAAAQPQERTDAD